MAIIFQRPSMRAASWAREGNGQNLRAGCQGDTPDEKIFSLLTALKGFYSQFWMARFLSRRVMDELKPDIQAGGQSTQRKTTEKRNRGVFSTPSTCRVASLN
jgi:hypothetical protein